MADTNVNADDLNSELLGDKLLLACGGAGARSTDPLPTCCADGNFDLSFDRILSNFGEGFETVVDEAYAKLSSNFTKAPAWAAAVKTQAQDQIAAYHHPLIAHLELESAVSPLWV